jgi:ketopantoate hydroxymethyltransferase
MEKKISMLTAYDFTMAKLSILLVLMLSLLEIQLQMLMAGHENDFTYY